MADPSPKADAIEDLMKATFGFDRRKHIAAGECAPPPLGCGQPVKDFVDELSEKEYTITGFCQECQDKIFVDVEH